MIVVLLEPRNVESTPLELKARIQSSHTTALELQEQLTRVESSPLELETRKASSHSLQQHRRKICIPLETKVESTPLESRRVSSHRQQLTKQVQGKWKILIQKRYKITIFKFITIHYLMTLFALLPEQNWQWSTFWKTAFVATVRMRSQIPGMKTQASRVMGRMASERGWNGGIPTKRQTIPYMFKFKRTREPWDPNQDSK